MKQTKLVSLIETFMTVGIGFCVSLVAWPFVGALYDIPYAYSSHLGITVIFTVLGLTRVYIIRRFFEGRIYERAYFLADKFNNWRSTS